MTGAKLNRNARRDGQAMVEFMVGLVGILFLLVGLFQITRIAVEDFDTILDAREEVAESLVGSTGSSGDYGENQSYSPNADFYPTLSDNIDYSGTLADYMSRYNATEDVDGFSFLAEGDDPLANMVGASKISKIAVESLLARLIGKDSITIENAVWMPTWDDLMPTVDDLPE